MIIRCFVFEKGVLANTIDVRYARGKHVLALPESLVLPHDHLSFKAGSKEEVLQQFADCVARHRLQIQTQTEVTGIVQHDDVFEVQTNAGAYRAASVVLAAGRGHLRELDVHDAKLPHVKYTVDNLQEYIGQHILIVGAGDSAANVALMLVEKNRVTIANRSPGFWKMNPSLKNQIDKKARDQDLTVYYNVPRKLDRSLR
jgi:thioredoxin reductase